MTSISQRALQPKDMPASEVAEHKGRNRIVTDEQVGDAFRWLAENATNIGASRKRLKRAENMLKRIEAIEFLKSEEKTEARKKAAARACDKWLEYADEEAEAYGEFETLKAQREDAHAAIEAWRSESANLRDRR